MSERLHGAELLDGVKPQQNAVGQGSDCTVSVEQLRMGKEGFLCSAGWR